MNKFYICGLGPGHEDYILPKVIKTIEECDVIIGGKRHTNGSYARGKAIENIEGRITEIPSIIKDRRKTEKICVLVSGDTGFFSLLKFLGKNFDQADYEVIPGISSIQYMFSRIKQYYQNQYIGSVHGRDLDVLKVVGDNKFSGLLTDAKMTPKKIAQVLLEDQGQDLKYKMHVGENLSYDHEKITSGGPEEIAQMTFHSLSVVIIENLEKEA